MKLNRYCDVDDFHEGLARVKSRILWGLIDASGNEVISCKYDESKNFHDGLARVRVDEKWALSTRPAVK